MEKNYLVIVDTTKKDDLKLNELSKSSASQNTLIIDDNSSCKYMKVNNSLLIKKGLKIIKKKKKLFEKNYWKISASHDGYLKNYNLIHEREIEFFPEQYMFIGTDKIIKKIIVITNLTFDFMLNLMLN